MKQTEIIGWVLFIAVLLLLQWKEFGGKTQAPKASGDGSTKLEISKTESASDDSLTSKDEKKEEKKGDSDTEDNDKSKKAAAGKKGKENSKESSKVSKEEDVQRDTDSGSTLMEYQDPEVDESSTESKDDQVNSPELQILYNSMLQISSWHRLVMPIVRLYASEAAGPAVGFDSPSPHITLALMNSLATSVTTYHLRPNEEGVELMLKWMHEKYKSSNPTLKAPIITDIALIEKIVADVVVIGNIKNGAGLLEDILLGVIPVRKWVIILDGDGKAKWGSVLKSLTKARQQGKLWQQELLNSALGICVFKNPAHVRGKSGAAPAASQTAADISQNEAVETAADLQRQQRELQTQLRQAIANQDRAAQRTIQRQMTELQSKRRQLMNPGAQYRPGQQQSWSAARVGPGAPRPGRRQTRMEPSEEVQPAVPSRRGAMRNRKPPAGEESENSEEGNELRSVRRAKRPRTPVSEEEQTAETNDQAAPVAGPPRRASTGRYTKRTPPSEEEGTAERRLGTESQEAPDDGEVESTIGKVRRHRMGQRMLFQLKDHKAEQFASTSDPVKVCSGALQSCVGCEVKEFCAPSPTRTNTTRGYDQLFQMVASKAPMAQYIMPLFYILFAQPKAILIDGCYLSFVITALVANNFDAKQIEVITSDPAQCKIPTQLAKAFSEIPKEKLQVKMSKRPAAVLAPKIVLTTSDWLKKYSATAMLRFDVETKKMVVIGKPLKKLTPKQKKKLGSARLSTNQKFRAVGPGFSAYSVSFQVKKSAEE